MAPAVAGSTPTSLRPSKSCGKAHFSVAQQIRRASRVNPGPRLNGQKFSTSRANDLPSSGDGHSSTPSCRLPVRWRGTGDLRARLSPHVTPRGGRKGSRLLVVRKGAESSASSAVAVAVASEPSDKINAGEVLLARLHRRGRRGRRRPAPQYVAKGGDSWATKLALTWHGQQAGLDRRGELRRQPRLRDARRGPGDDGRCRGVPDGDASHLRQPDRLRDSREGLRRIWGRQSSRLAIWDHRHDEAAVLGEGEPVRVGMLYGERPIKTTPKSPTPASCTSRAWRTCTRSISVTRRLATLRLTADDRLFVKCERLS